MFSTHQQKETNCPSNKGNAPFFSKSIIQPKLTINAPGDAHEQEADAMADKVMRMTIPQSESFFKPSISSVQRKCTGCEEEKVHRKENSETEVQASSNLDNYVSSLSSSGKSLPETTRQFFEPRFGHDFSNVRIHTDSVAAKSAESINALAYTTGNNIVFNQGQYSPNSDSGQRLLAHELTHVVQQGKSIGPKRIQRNRCTYGEIRQWAIRSQRDLTAPAGLADAKASIEAACSRGQHCHCVNGANATAPGDRAAWNNIVAATGGTDLSGGGNFMCVGTQQCGFVHQCRPAYRPGQPVPPLRERTTNLQSVGTATVSGHTIYFYSDPRNGNC